MTLEQARRFEDLLRANTQDAHFAFETIFDESSFAGQQRSRKKFRMLRRIAPRLREILREGERVRYLTRGRRYAERESFLAGFAVGLLNRRAVVVTNQRIILLQIGNRSKPKDFVEQIRYTAIADVSPTRFDNIRITFSTGERITLVGVAAADRAFLARLIEFTREKVEPEAYGLEQLCGYCYQPINGHLEQCPHCRGTFKSARSAALLSLVFPGFGDWYLGHLIPAAFEIAVFAWGWMVIINMHIRWATPTTQFLLTCVTFFLVGHVGDALVTFKIASMGLYRTVPEKLTPVESVVRFATVVSVFLLAVVGVLVQDYRKYLEYQRQEAAEFQEKMANDPRMQQARAAQAERVEQITVAELAERIAATDKEWSVVFLYSIQNWYSQQAFPQLIALHQRYADQVEFELYSVDQDADVPDIPVYIAKQGAAFAPRRITRWPPGELGSQMKTVGINVGSRWAIPLVALLDRQGKVLWQAQGLQQLNQLEMLLEQNVDAQQ